MGNLGLYVAIEGPTGVGKSTVIRHMRDLRPNWFYVAEPFIGRSFYDELKHGIEDEPNSIIAMKFAINRYEGQQKYVIPALRNNLVVVTDRSVWSSYVYNADNTEEVGVVSYCNINNIWPDVTYWLDANTNIIENRLERRGGEKRVYDKRASQSKKYLILQDEVNNFFNINVDEDAAEAAREIIGYIDRRME